MHTGFILTKSPSEQGFKTFIDLSQAYIYNDQLSIYLVGNGVYCTRKGYSNSDLEMIFKHSNVYAYIDDIKARGIVNEEIKEFIVLFSQYEHLVIDIMENFDQVLTF